MGKKNPTVSRLQTPWYTSMKKKYGERESELLVIATWNNYSITIYIKAKTNNECE